MEAWFVANYWILLMIAIVIFNLYVSLKCQLRTLERQNDRIKEILVEFKDELYNIRWK